MIFNNLESRLQEIETLLENITKARKQQTLLRKERIQVRREMREFKLVEKLANKITLDKLELFVSDLRLSSPPTSPPQLQLSPPIQVSLRPICEPYTVTESTETKTFEVTQKQVFPAKFDNQQQPRDRRPIHRARRTNKRVYVERNLARMNDPAEAHEREDIRRVAEPISRMALVRMRTEEAHEMIGGLSAAVVNFSLIIEDDNREVLTSELTPANGVAENPYRLLEILSDFFVDPDVVARQDLTQTTRDSSTVPTFVSGWLELISTAVGFGERRVITSGEAAVQVIDFYQRQKRDAAVQQRKRNKVRGGGSDDPTKIIKQVDDETWFIPKSSSCLISCLSVILNIEKSEVLQAADLYLKSQKRRQGVGQLTLNGLPFNSITPIISKLKKERKEQLAGREIIYMIKDRERWAFVTLKVGSSQSTRKYVSSKVLPPQEAILYIPEHTHFIICKDIPSQFSQPDFPTPPINFHDGLQLKQEYFLGKHFSEINPAPEKDLTSTQIMAYDFESFENEGVQQWVYGAGYTIISEIYDQSELQIREQLDSLARIFVAKDLKTQPIKNMLDSMVEEMVLENKYKGLALAHNGSGYDAWLIFANYQNLSDKYIIEVQKNGSKIIELTVKSIEKFHITQWNTNPRLPFYLENESPVNFEARCKRIFLDKKSAIAKSAKKALAAWQLKGQKELSPKDRIKKVVSGPMVDGPKQIKIAFRCSILMIAGFPISLSALQASMKMTPDTAGGLMKQSFDICAITKDNYLDSADWIEYLKLDVVGLAKMIAIAREKNSKIDIDPLKFQTQGQGAYQGWLKDCDLAKERPHKIKNSSLAAFLRGCAVGGRVVSNSKKFTLISDEQAIEVSHQPGMKMHIPAGREADKLRGYILSGLIDADATSLYPSAQYLPSFCGWNLSYPGPLGAVPNAPNRKLFCRQATKEDEDLINNTPWVFHNRFIGLGEMTVKIKDGMHFPILSTKTATKTNLWANGTIKIKNATNEVAWGLFNGIIEWVKFDRVMIFASAKSLFRPTQKKLFEYRMANKNDVALKFLIKVQMNSIFGKCIQKNPPHIIAAVHKNSDALRLFDKERALQVTELGEYLIIKMDNPIRFKEKVPIHLGVCTLSNSKVIANCFISAINGFREPRIFYSDTDSFFIPADQLAKIIACAIRNTLQDGETFEDLLASKDYENRMGGIKNDLGADAAILWYRSPGQKQKYVIIATVQPDKSVILEAKRTFKGCAKKALPSFEDFITFCEGTNLAIPLDTYTSFPAPKSLGLPPRIHTTQESYLKWEQPGIRPDFKRVNGKKVEIPKNCRLYIQNWDNKQEAEFKPFTLSHPCEFEITLPYPPFVPNQP